MYLFKEKLNLIKLSLYRHVIWLYSFVAFIDGNIQRTSFSLIIPFTNIFDLNYILKPLQSSLTK